MLDYTATRGIIEDYIRDNFDVTECPVKYENVPLDTDLQPYQIKHWIAVFDKPSVSESLEMGEQTAFMSGGSIIIQIFSQLDEGTADSRAVAVTLSTLLSDKEIGGMYFQEPELHPVVTPKGAEWYQMNLVIDYKVVME